MKTAAGCLAALALTLLIVGGAGLGAPARASTTGQTIPTVTASTGNPIEAPLNDGLADPGPAPQTDGSALSFDLWTLPCGVAACFLALLLTAIFGIKRGRLRSRARE